jgi:hypothetical protein
VIVCETADLDCQTRAETWSAERRSLQVSKSERGFHFPSQAYVFYLVLPLAVAAH